MTGLRTRVSGVRAKPTRVRAWESRGVGIGPCRSSRAAYGRGLMECPAAPGRARLGRGRTPRVRRLGEGSPDALTAVEKRIPRRSARAGQDRFASFPSAARQPRHPVISMVTGFATLSCRGRRRVDLRLLAWILASCGRKNLRLYPVRASRPRLRHRVGQSRVRTLSYSEGVRDA